VTLETLRDLGDGILVADSSMGSYEDMNGVFLVRARRPALVEAGTGLSAERTHAALDAAGLSPRDLAWIVVTHVHLDHAGGAGELARRFPAATVVVHPAGARHLADPTRLVSSARRVHGDLMDTVYGPMIPVDGARVHAAEDGAVIDLGDRGLRVVHTPGHAPHHLAVQDTASGALFAGDAAGVRVPGMTSARPACPPPHFDRDATLASMRAMAALDPTRIILTHFGDPGDPAEFLADAQQRLARWCSVAEDLAETADAARLEAELLERFASDEGMAVDDPDRFAIMGGFESNAAGLLRWALARRKRQSEI
jgi:glyoxylase-like metal-dependent hydrolase (beta-lactamase superfamily II)